MVVAQCQPWHHDATTRRHSVDMEDCQWFLSDAVDVAVCSNTEFRSSIQLRLADLPGRRASDQVPPEHSLFVARRFEDEKDGYWLPPIDHHDAPIAPHALDRQLASRVQHEPPVQMAPPWTAAPWTNARKLVNRQMAPNAAQIEDG